MIALSIDFAENQIKEIGKKDAKLLIGTALVCWLYLCKLMGFVKSTASILNLLMSLPVSLVIYKLVLRQDYFSVIHMASILILVTNGVHSLLIWHYSKRVKPIFVVSAVSFVAYSSSLTKRVMPLKEFGIFAMVLVPVIAISVSIFQPILYYFLRKEVEEPFYFPPARLDKSTQTPTRAKWISFIFKWRVVIVILGCLFFATNLLLTMQVSTGSLDENILHKNHPIQKAMDWYQNEIWQDPHLQIDFVWNVEDLGHDSFKVMKHGFDPSIPKNQVYLYEICQKLLMQPNVVE